MADEKIVLVQEEPRGASQTVEIPIIAGQGDINFPDIPELRSDQELKVIIKGIRHISPKVSAFGPVTGTANTPLADLPNIFLQIYSEGWLRGFDIPLLTLNDMADADAAAATTIPYRTKATKLADWKIGWNKSKVHFAPGTVASINSVLVLDIEFARFIKNDSGQWDEVIGPA